MPRILLAGAIVGLFGVTAIKAAILDISIADQGDNYTNLVADTKLRGDNIDGPTQTPYADWNLGASSGGSMRFYANFVDGITYSTRSNTFLQRFEVSSIPPGSKINSATLTVYLANQTANNRTFTNVNLSRLKPGKVWVETYQDPLSPTNGPSFDGSVTWNNRVSLETNAVPWARAGALGADDIDLGTNGTQTFDVVGVADQATTIVRDITAWVQDWVNTPTDNTGMAWWPQFQGRDRR